ncbi:MAG: ABC transporter permease [Candidatus Korarchaeota archaeon]|nr:ABC transporter permease [Thermoproteota archaeon]
MTRHVINLYKGFFEIVKKLFPFLTLFSVWELTSTSGIVSKDILPAFSDVAKSIFILLKEDGVLYNLWISLYRSLAGLTISISVGILIGYLIAYNKILRWLINPLITLTYPLPKTALVPLTMFWLGITNEAAIFVIFLGCLLPIVVNTYNGVISVDYKLIWSARCLGTPENKLFWRVVIPASIPHITNGIRIALPLSFILTISVELVGSRAGIGTLISLYGNLGNYDLMFAAILLYVIIAVIIDRFVSTLINKLTKWREGVEHL